MAGLLERISARTPRVRASVDPVTMDEFGYLLGQTTGMSVRTKAGNTVGARRVLGLTAWYSGARYISETVSMLPWKHYMKLPGDVREERADWPWLAKPDVDQTFAGVIEHICMSLIHKGNGLAWKLRNSLDQVVGLREIHPERTTGGTAPDGSKRFLIDNDPTPYTTREILHVPGLAYDGRFGLNPIATLADALGIVAAADDFAGRWFGNNTHVGGIISLPGEVNAIQLKQTREEWDQFHQGLLNAHKTGVLSRGATYSRITLNAEDAQLLESRVFGISEIARILRIPPHKMYELSRATFSNIEHQSIEATTDSIRPWVQRIENAINADRDLVGEGHYLEAEMEGMLRGDSAARATANTAGIQGGWLMPATAARRENLPAGPELEYYLRPLNMTVIRPGEPEPPPPSNSLERAGLALQQLVSDVIQQTRDGSQS